MSVVSTDLFRRFRLMIRYFKSLEEVPVADEMTCLWDRIRRDSARQKRKARLRYCSVAVLSAALLAGFVWTGFYRRDSSVPDIRRIAARWNDTVATGENIRLKMSAGHSIPVRKGASVTYSSDGAVRVDRKEVAPTTEEEFYNQLIVPNGQHTRLTLADGSRLYVNAGTKVIYPRRFEKHRREIYVEGEIFIEVAPDKKAPFRVKTDQFEINVIGTAFNVCAYKGEASAQVALLRGAVELKDCRETMLNLSPDQLAVLEQGVISSKKDVAAADYRAWTEGLLVLHTEPLETVFRKLSRYYGVKIVCDSGIGGWEIKGTLDLNQPLEEVLRRISVIAPVRYEKNGKGYNAKEK